MTKSLFQKIAARRVKQWLREDRNWVKNERLWAALNPSSSSISIYKYPDGRVLYFYELTKGGVGRLFQSDEKFMEYVALRLKSREEGDYHILRDKQPYKEAFPEHVSELIQTLGQKLRLKPEELDFSEDSLIRVDNAIRKYGKAKSLEVPVFPALVAYTGEVIAKAIGGGTWEMIQDKKDTDIWEPWIVRKGVYYQSFIIVFDELNEQSPFSIAGAIGGHIRVGGRKKPV
jgi:hypothetical protein